MKTAAGGGGRVGGKGRKERRVKAGKEYGEGGKVRRRRRAQIKAEYVLYKILVD